MYPRGISKFFKVPSSRAAIVVEEPPAAPSNPSSDFNALPSADSRTAWEAAMKTYGQPNINSPWAGGSSIYNDERSPLFYDGAHTYHMQDAYWTSHAATPDATYAAGAASLSDHLWSEYAGVYGTIDGSNNADGYRKRSQWVFATSAERESAPHLKDMTEWSSYAAYNDGHQDAYDDSDARGLGYLVDAYCRYKRTTGLDIFLYGRNQLPHIAPILESYCNNLGPVSPKTKEIYFQLGVLGFMMMSNEDILDNYINTRDCVANIVQYISTKCELINTDQYRLKYGTGFIDDGAGGNEANAYYPGLEMVCVAMFKWFPTYQAYADGLWEYAVANVDLTLQKDYAEHYRYSLPYIMDRTALPYTFTPKNPATTNTKFGLFDGTDDVVTTANTDWPFTNTTPWSVGITYTHKEAGSKTDPLIYIEGANNQGATIYVSATGVGCELRFGGATYNIDTLTTGFTPVVDTNYQIFIEYNGSGLASGVKIYVDGALRTLGTATESNTGSWVTAAPTTNPLTFGKGASNFSNTAVFEISIWDKVVLSSTRSAWFSKSTITEEPNGHWDFDVTSGTTVTERTGNGTNGTLAGDTGSNFWTYVGYSAPTTFTPKDPTLAGTVYLSCDGVDDVINFAAADYPLDALDAQSVFIQMYPANTGSYNQSPFEQIYTQDYTFSFHFSTGVNLQVYVLESSASKYIFRTFSNAGWPSTVNELWSVAITYDGSGLTSGINAYVNGVKGTGDAGTKVGTFTTPGFPSVGHQLGKGRTTFTASRYYQLAYFYSELSEANALSLTSGTAISILPDRSWLMNENSGTSLAEDTGAGSVATITNPNASDIWQVVGGFDLTTVGSGTSVLFDFNPQATASILNTSDTEATDAQNVKTMQDQSGNGHHATQDTDSNRLVLDVDGINGHPSLQGASGDFMLMTGSEGVLRNLPGFTFAHVIRFNNIAAPQGLFQQWTATLLNDRLNIYFDGTGSVYVKFRNPDTTSNDQYTNAQLTTATVHVMVVRLDLAGGEFSLWIDGTEVRTEALTGTSNFSDTLSSDPVCLFGTEPYSNTSQCRHGRMAGFGEALSDTDIGTLSTGLTSDWAAA